MTQEERLIPYKRIRRFLRSEVKGIVSKEACEFMQNYLENFLREICKDVITQHQEQNRLRDFHGLPEYKRIGVSEFISLCEKLDKEMPGCLIEGEVAKLGNTTLSRKQKKEVVKC